MCDNDGDSIPPTVGAGHAKSAGGRRPVMIAYSVSNSMTSSTSSISSSIVRVVLLVATATIGSGAREKRGRAAPGRPPDRSGTSEVL